MVGSNRLSYISYTKLKMIATHHNKTHEPNLCYIPMCRYCKAWLINKIAVYQDFGSRRFTCVNCYINKYGKKVFRKKLLEHLNKLSTTDRTLRSLRGKYLELLLSI
jgi:hypothetical protein